MNPEDDAPAARFLSILRKTQWLPPRELHAYVSPLLARLIRHAATQTAYYPERLGPLFDGGDPATAPIDFSRWHEVPILRRTHVIDHIEGLKARETPRDVGVASEGSTSGTTGRAVDFLRSGVARMAEICTNYRLYEIFDFDLSGTLAFITSDKEGTCQYPQGSRFEGWNRTDRSSPLWVLDVATQPADQLEWLERIKPDYVLTYPSCLAEVAAVAAERGSPLRFKTLIATGEPLDPVTADRLMGTFGCDVIDLYAAREIGVIAFECPDSAGYHVAAETTFCEIVDEAGKPVPPGEFGRVVVTALYNYAMPFIRYDVGDHAVRSATPCRCGRGLPKLERIGGRARSAFALPDGNRRALPGLVVRDIARCLSYRELQVAQIDLYTVEIRYVPQDVSATPDIEGLTAIFRTALHPGVAVNIKPVERFERTTGMKFEQFISYVSDQSQLHDHSSS